MNVGLNAPADDPHRRLDVEALADACLVMTRTDESDKPPSRERGQDGQTAA